MRTACLVIAILLFSIPFPGYPQESAASQEGRVTGGGIDQDITLTGGDETALPVPPPGGPGPLLVPDVDLQRPPAFFRAPMLPPTGAGAAPPAEWRVKDPFHAG